MGASIHCPHCNNLLFVWSSGTTAAAASAASVQECGSQQLGKRFPICHCCVVLFMDHWSFAFRELPSGAACTEMFIGIYIDWVVIRYFRAVNWGRNVSSSVQRMCAVENSTRYPRWWLIGYSLVLLSMCLQVWFLAMASSFRRGETRAHSFI